MQTGTNNTKICIKKIKQNNNNDEVCKSIINFTSYQ